MKFIRILVFSFFLAPVASFGASNDFMVAAQLLAAAKSADIQQVQALVNNGADVNFVDSTGLSIVCTALMNNDVRAAQILQMYGADASNCDRQIKKFNNKNKPRGGGGLFSGLSSAQGIGLAAAGAAVVVGGLFLLTDVFDPGNDNDTSNGGGDRPNNNPGDGGNGGGNLTAAFTLPYGPALPTAADESARFVGNLDAFSPDDDSIFAKNFEMMTDDYGQNYLLVMNGYAPMARGYLGMQTLRATASKGPLDLAGVNWFTTPVLGGRPVNVAMVTENGINSNGYAYNVDAKNSLTDTLLPWTTTNGTTVSNADNSMVSSKYYNNQITLGTGDATRSDATTAEDSVALGNFDLAGFGTVVNNAYASDMDDLLAKVVGGRTSGYANADFVGFMPNGQMTIYRTGDGMEFANTENVGTGTYVETDGELSEIVLFGKNLTVSLGDGNSFLASYTEMVTGDNGEPEDVTTTYSGYLGTNGLLYIDSGADGNINQAYQMENGALTLKQELQTADYFNYKALRNAANLWMAGDLINGRSKPDVIANVSVIEPLHAKSVETIEDILSLANNTQQQAGLSSLVNKYYDNVDNNSYFPGADAVYVFGNLGSNFAPLTIFSTGAFETDSTGFGKTLSATFENSVPLVYENSEHLFMSVVGVGLTGDGTTGTTTVSGYAPSGKVALTQWSLNNGTPGDASDDKYYKARMCGVAGTGLGDIDPWCFAAAGVTDELAVASVAGAAGAIKSAFSYLTNKQIFALMALTADGPFLGKGDGGEVFTEETLANYLQNMYELPNEKQAEVDGGADYLRVFAEVFGYGLINLERATKPGTSVYYYNGDNIVSGSGNAFWRAATNTVFRPSSVLNLRGATIRAPYFDVLENVDGTMSLPRVWENEFAFGAGDERGLYMGDVLGDFKTRRENTQRNQIGALGLSMSFSERAYNDNLNGLDNLSLDYAIGHWNFGASYQNYFTDGVSRFSGLANPVLGLMSNAVVSDVVYNSGKWSFGARAFSGAITDEGLLENNPTISAQYMPARLGLMQGGAANVAWTGDKFKFIGSVGNAHETDTLLGAQTGGLLNLGDGDTMYVDAVAQYKVSDMVDLTARATFAQTRSNARGEFVMGLTDITSNAFAIGANIGNFEFGISQPLAITDGALQYAYAQYDVVDAPDNGYQLNVIDTHVEDLSLRPEKREMRLMGTYRHQFGDFTDGAVGFIYRINPNHTDDFGNESIFMMKLTHRLGI